MRTTALVSLVAALGVAACATQHRERVSLPAEKNALWRSECGACHQAFPPMMLTVGNWQAMMRELEQHFGEDASLDEASRQEIAAYLQRNGAPDSYGRHSASSLRITDTAYFQRRHKGSSVPLWRRTGENKPSNCPACHKASDEQLW
ncbi:cytochrome C [Rhodocyclus tenuis]|uniref:Mono/diheme cytochrome c family protein n=1 Tax=Rhodocyclus tenuis TaxID=1066 RepID=A0A840G367_RHOTE|nr:cytochrome C [Rhodocyclus tenuis]MBB4248814.1 mono/diheme cytochrome c family protein [Rhodocyclus tenuis]MBK1680770.1 hypothetical protein [Rhodocyclus tenuis]